MKTVCVVAWHNPEQRAKFLDAWGISSASIPEWLVLQQDKEKQGCARTKNAGIKEALARGAEIPVILDDDCFPSDEARTLPELMEKHTAALEPVEVERFRVVTDPPSRGTPYFKRTMVMPVAASMGFWLGVGDYCAPRQLAFGARHPMKFDRRPIFGDYFALSGMNMAFRRDWAEVFQFIDVPRMDDIWMGTIAQRIAYAHGFCFNINGPIVTHSRQSNLWQSLRDEVKHLEANEDLWLTIANHPSTDYATLRALLPC